MPIIITPGAFTESSSFAPLAERLGAQIVVRPRRRKVQLDTGGLRFIGFALDSTIRDSPEDGTPLLEWRVALAKELLRTERPAVAHVAQRVGYQSATAFTTAFARVAGCSPTGYARDMASQPAGRGGRAVAAPIRDKI